jgi:3-methyladenine DNA glycosylase AlkD
MHSIARLQSLLDARASARSRDWWTRYMKGVIPFRGVGIPIIREVVADWRDAAAPVEEQFETALALIRERMAEDKLAGVLYLQNYLIEPIPWRTALPRYAELFDEGSISDWNITDWFCVRVLGPTIQHHGLPCARAIASWHKAENLWRARASAVAFVNLTADPRFHDLFERSCTTLIRRDERFAKTAVGWVLRELSRHDRARVEAVIREHEAHFSRESLRNARKYF